MEHAMNIRPAGNHTYFHGAAAPGGVAGTGAVVATREYRPGFRVAHGAESEMSGIKGTQCYGFGAATVSTKKTLAVRRVPGRFSARSIAA